MIKNNPVVQTPNDIAIQKFIDAGLTYQDIGSKEFYLLVRILEKELAKYTDLDGDTLPMQISKKPKRNAMQVTFYNTGWLKSGFIKVDSFYFEGREGISFNENGWIGFAGWASSSNTKPFTDAFCSWVDMISDKAGMVSGKESL